MKIILNYVNEDCWPIGEVYHNVKTFLIKDGYFYISFDDNTQK